MEGMSLGIGAPIISKEETEVLDKKFKEKELEKKAKRDRINTVFHVYGFWFLIVFLAGIYVGSSLMKNDYKTTVQDAVKLQRMINPADGKGYDLVYNPSLK